jgi:CRISPR-associated endonuclease Cas1
MLTQRNAGTETWPEEARAWNGVVVAGGYGVRISVWRGRLRVDDGSGRERRSKLYHRATSGLKRLVVLGHTGYVSLEALRWLADIKAAYLQVDADGRVLATFGPPGTDRPSLRRAQATASQSEKAIELSRWLVDAKLEGQLATLRQFADATPTEEAQAVVTSYRRLLRDAKSIDDLRASEAWAAGAYWQALAPLPVKFARRDVDRVPNHWQTFGGRSSLLANGPRLATNPANAVLNYLYALLEGEATLAARIVGLDPGLGIMHADQAHRDSLAADLMEPVRPMVDAYAFGLLASRPFAARDFYETRAGVCRVTAPLTHELAGTLPNWRQLVGRVAEDLAAALEGRLSTGRTSPTPISGRRRGQGRPTGAAPVGAMQPVASKRACSWCGEAVLGSRKRKTCSEACRDKVLAQVHLGFAATSSERMRRYDRTNHPGLTPEANRKRSETRKRQRAEELTWEREHPGRVDPRLFTNEVLPKLDGLSARAVARATGLSVGHCARIKRGERVPHPRWWLLLDTLSP